MDFSLTPDDEAFRDELTAWLDANLEPFLAEWSERPNAGAGDAANRAAAGFDRTQARRQDWQRRLNQSRWAAINWPRAWNGREATPMQNVIYAEEMARVRAPGIYNANGIWQIGPMILQWGTTDQQRRWLPGILNADEHWCQGFSEPDAGSDLANIATTAIDDGDGYVVNGQKTWVSSAHLAKWGLFLLRTDPGAIGRGAKHEGITAFIVDLETSGIECRPIRDVTGDTMLNDVFFTDARLPADDRLGGEGEGWLVAMSTLGHERVGTAGLSITMAADLRSMISSARSANPDALRDPDLRDRIARAFTDIELTRLLNFRALTKIIKGEKNWPEVPLAKLQWSKISQTLAELAIDLLGPAGLLAKGGSDAVDGGSWTRNYAWQRYTSIGAGATEIQKNIIAKKAIKLPRH
ncbi:MAG TPA: acyl-CoA dehydrogenase family protein [Acidimicrobiia bacterium]|nr:acyl-CoA dehydrogenase family protein [Acidimicrobiia bacterium]